MTYYAYLAFNDGSDDPNSNEGGDRPFGGWRRKKPLVCMDVVRGRKDGQKRLDQLLAKHPDLPQTGWKKIMHYQLDTDDNRQVEALKLRIRQLMATMSITRKGERRKWAKTPGMPAGFYELEFHEANGIMQIEIRDRGFYKTSSQRAA